MLVFFAVFCALVASGVYAGWRYYSSATDSVAETLALKYVDTGVLRQQAGSNVLQDLAKPLEIPQPCAKQQFLSTSACDFFTEGQRLVGRRGAGFGPVASLVLPDGTRVNLHTQPEGFDFSLKKYRVSRWTNEKQEVVFDQNAGYARYDLARDQPYKSVSFAVQVGGATIYLAPGGSYSIDVPREEDGNPRGRLITDAPLLAEVAVRRGTARIQTNGESLDLHDGDLVQIAVDGSLVTNGNTPYQDAAWELISDGDFSQFSTAQYNSPGETTSWNINDYSEAQRPAGRFTVLRTCPPEKRICVPEEFISYGQFEREVGDSKPYQTGVLNPIGVDVTEYIHSLRFSAEVSVIKQSVTNTGDAGSECPVMVEIFYKIGSPRENDLRYVTCAFYLTPEEPNYNRDPNIYPYFPIERFAFYPISVDLRLLPDGENSIRRARYISSVRVYANGHDYLSQVTRVSLVGK